ncbi:hypothetical protein [Endozoicomonas sp. ALB032]|uniref:hypothetical protein n=1 Tax=Endozoicomonas sp. ALB032 TaxID=3403082 RepID=UPI003BB7C189
MIRKFKEMRLIFYQLARPLSYLRIKHEDKWIYDWLVPLILSAATIFLFYKFIPTAEIVSKDGVISQIADFIANLPGFFIAALAAVATFNKNDIDELMANPPKIEILHHGNPLMVEMTRRRFLCVLFSYLTAVSILIVLGARIALNLTIPSEYYVIFSWLGITVFIYAVWQMITATLLGLYYLGERLHSPQ